MIFSFILFVYFGLSISNESMIKEVIFPILLNTNYINCMMNYQWVRFMNTNVRTPTVKVNLS